MTLQKPGTYRNSDLTPVSISGIAGDTAPGQIDKVEVRVLRNTGLAFYLSPALLTFSVDPGVTNPELTWIKATYDTDWTAWKLSSAIPWVSGESYDVMARVKDRAGNYVVAYQTHTFKFDVTPPQSGLSYPTNSSYVKSLASLSGTMADYPQGGLLSSGTVPTMRLQVQRKTDGFYWDGGGWLTGVQVVQSGAAGMEVWLDSWTIKAPNLPTLTSGVSYYLTTSGRDDASVGNPEVYGHVRSSTFTFDNTPPVTTIILPSNGATYQPLGLVTGVTTDAVGVDTVAISLQNTSIAPPNCYRPVQDDFAGTCPNWFGAQGTPLSWNYDTTQVPWVTGNFYLLKSSSTDLAANLQTAPVGNSFKIDSGSPAVGLTVPSGVAGYLNATQTTIVGTASDVDGVLSIDVAISSSVSGIASWYFAGAFTSDFSNAVYMTTTSYTPGGPDSWTRSLTAPANINALLENGKTYVVRLRARDKAVPFNESLNDFTFLYDTVKPVASIANPVQGVFKSAAFTLSGGASDTDPDGGGPLLASNASAISISIQRQGGLCYLPGFGFTEGCPNWFTPAGAPGAWSYTPTPNPYADGEVYIVTARATDFAGNVQSGFAGGTSLNSFTYDTTKPGALVQAPGAPRVKALTTLLGTSSDALPGVLQQVQLRVARNSGLTFYLSPSLLTFSVDPGVTDPELTWFKANYNGADWTNWQASSAIPWVSGSSYTVMARSQDMGGNYSVPISTWGFVYDTDAPQSGISFPADTAIINSLPSLSGTMGDFPQGANLSSGTVTVMRLQVQRKSDGKYFDGSDWQPGVQTIQSGAAGMQVWIDSWTIKSANLPTMTSGASYYLTSAGIDDTSGGGNAALFGLVGSSTFTFDNSPATASIAAPLDAKSYQILTLLSGGVADNIGVSTVSLSIQKVGSNCYREVLNDFAGACPNWFKAFGTPAAWTYSFPSNPWVQAAQYVVRSSATDQAANMQVAMSSAGFTYDIGVPTSALVAPALSGYLNDGQTTLFAGTAVDSPAGLLSVDVAFSDNGGAANSWWNAVNFTGLSPSFLATGGTPAAWTLDLTPLGLANGKTYTARVRTRDQALPFNERQLDSTFLFDNAEPTASAAVPANGSFKNSNFTLSGGSSDPTRTRRPVGRLLGVDGVGLHPEAGTATCYAYGLGFTAGCPNYIPAFGAPATWTLPSPTLT